jgi:hypothetical protein
MAELTGSNSLTLAYKHLFNDKNALFQAITTFKRSLKMYVQFFVLIACFVNITGGYL